MLDINVVGFEFDDMGMPRALIQGLFHGLDGFFAALCFAHNLKASPLMPIDICIWHFSSHLIIFRVLDPSSYVVASGVFRNKVSVD